MSLATCDNCGGLASKQLSDAVGSLTCGPCCTGEAASLDEYMDYFEADDSAEGRAA